MESALHQKILQRASKVGIFAHYVAGEKSPPIECTFQRHPTTENSKLDASMQKNAAEKTLSSVSAGIEKRPNATTTARWIVGVCARKQHLRTHLPKRMFPFHLKLFPIHLGHRVLGKTEKSCSDNGSHRWQARIQRCSIDCHQWWSILCLWRYSLSDNVVLLAWHRNKSNDSIGFCQFGQIEAIRRSAVRSRAIPWHLHVRWAQADRIFE